MLSVSSQPINLLASKTTTESDEPPDKLSRQLIVDPLIVTVAFMIAVDINVFPEIDVSLTVKLPTG